MQLKKLTRAQRRTIFAAARNAAVAGQHDLARELFASVGVSYVLSAEQALAYN